MRFYRVVYHDSEKGTAYGWFLLKREANAGARKFLRAFHADRDARAKVEPVDIAVSGPGVLAALQKFAANNGNSE